VFLEWRCVITNRGRGVDKALDLMLPQPGRQRGEDRSHFVVGHARADDNSPEWQSVMRDDLIPAAVNGEQGNEPSSLEEKQRGILKTVPMVVQIAAFEHEVPVARTT